MNNTNNSSPDPAELSSGDIQQLLHAQQASPPSHLDERIRAMAKAAIDEEAHPTSTPGTQNTAEMLTPPRKGATLSVMFATAAMVVVAVVLVPLLNPSFQTEPMSIEPTFNEEPAPPFDHADSAQSELELLSEGQVMQKRQSPQASFKEAPLASSQAMAPAPAPAPESVSDDRSQLDKISTLSERPSAVQNIESIVSPLKKMRPVEEQLARKMDTSASMDSDVNMDHAESAFSARSHREPVPWIKDISRWYASGQVARSIKELTAFREAYPSHHLENTLPLDLLNRMKTQQIEQK